MSAPAQVVLDASPPEVIIRLMLTFDRAADDHLDDCARRGFTPRTIATYRRTYNLLSTRLPRDQDVSKVTTDDIRRFLGAHTHLAPGTLAGYEAHLSSLFRQLYMDGKIARDPMDRLIRTKRKRPEDLDVVTVDAATVRLLLAAGQTWTEKLAPAMPAYLGPRRRAVASALLTDIDRAAGPGLWRMRFREKGKQLIWKPVPQDLERLIRAAEADGAYDRYRYIVPPEGYLTRDGDRDDRVIWRVIRRLADRVGVDCHVHALRAAFACFYDESFPGDVLALRDLMGHASVKTTELYLRRRDKEAGMQRVRSLSWQPASPDLSANSGHDVCVLSSMGAGGFEPPCEDDPHEQTGGGTHELAEALKDRAAVAHRDKTEPRQDRGDPRKGQVIGP